MTEYDEHVPREFFAQSGRAPGAVGMAVLGSKAVVGSKGDDEGDVPMIVLDDY